MLLLSLETALSEDLEKLVSWFSFKFQKKKFLLLINILFPSTKFVQCQTVLRNALKTSQNEDIKALWKSTSNHINDSIRCV